MIYLEGCAECDLLKYELTTNENQQKYKIKQKGVSVVVVEEEFVSNLLLGYCQVVDAQGD